MTSWTKLAAILADELTAAGKLRSPEWQEAVRVVPRHELVPVHYTMDPYTGDWQVHDTADDLPRVYSNAPYDRIIATCSVPAIPWAWVEQTREQGLILADVKIGKQAGNLVLLRRRGQLAEGRFDSTYGSFMGIRRDGGTYQQPCPATVSRHHGSVRERTTMLDLTRPWEHPPFWFFAHTVLPPGTSFSLRVNGPDQPPRNTVLHAPDGSWCEVREDPDNGTRQVWEAGPHPLWRIIEDTHTEWLHLGKPGWERFGLTVTPDHQFSWLDTSGSPRLLHSVPRTQ